ncbi:type VI secretion system Vgr family protein [Chondromyces apiculatus]|uniref:VgrG protein n=1 Tax=Chondromyces apiculatus DSM 436 TaxID=1192034 RepID=A0A017TGW2_9BACT|nr:type VI secretion system tip protein TssI/VgrG [Chondromyces apiculatus]EYF08513.1 VgrG protein [Chondromyces apiculatus DSM 436]
MSVSISFQDPAITLLCNAMDGRERLGEAHEFTIEGTSPEPFARDAVVGRGCLVVIEGGHGARTIAGIVTRCSALATSSRDAARNYKLIVRSMFAQLELRTRTKTFQNLATPDIVRQVVADGAFGDSAVRVDVRGTHDPRPYVVQYGETDAAFVRRLCEDDGLSFRFEAGEASETFILADTSTAAAAVLDEPLVLLDRAGDEAARPTAFAPRSRHLRRPGKVTLRDYDYRNPAVNLEGVATGGKGPEQDTEVYTAPGRFSDPGAGDARARLALEALRADATTVSFGTTAFALAPGVRVDVEPSPDLRARTHVAGGYLVVGLKHHFRSGGAHTLEVEAIPIDTPLRLPRITPRPKIAGVQTAFVTGASGEEVHVDALGCVRVHFPWDREGTQDDKSSLRIRVMQPQMPGSMLLPRVGWEVVVAYEDGDPDRPYVIGRLYNNKHPPPYSLPANKTATVVGTSSSPGAARQNVIRFDDAAGKEVIAVGAGFGKKLTIAHDMLTQIVKNEALTVKASQTLSVGGSESISVTEAYLNDLGSQSASVGGMQSIYVKGDLQVGVGSESVIIGGACLEKVGNPVSGALNLAKSAALQGVGSLGKVGAFVSAAAGLAQVGYQGYKQGGLAAVQGSLAMAADALVPGGSVALSAIAEAMPRPWAERPLAQAPQAGGGGASSASDTAGPQGPGPGHRNTIVEGMMTEIIGAALGVATPGTIGWTTVGPSTLLVGASHNIRAGQAGVNILGASSEALGSLSITSAGTLTRDVTGALQTSIAGALKSKAGGTHTIKAGAALKVKIGGALKMKGAHVTFVVGGSRLSTSPSGVLVEASTIEVTGTTKQKGASSTS